MVAGVQSVLEALTASRDRIRPFGSHVEHHDSIGSTNDRAAALAAGAAPEGTLVIAGEQTRGRGRSGNSWFSPAGAGLYVSAVLRPRPRSSEDAGWTRLITLAAGVALSEGIEAATGLRPSIKWPNDIVLSGGHAAHGAGDRRYGGWRKVAGILAEGTSQGGTLEHIVLGFGINVGEARWPAEIVRRVASLEGDLGRPVDRGVLLVEILASMRTHYESLRNGNSAPVLGRWRRLAPAAQGARVRWIGHPSALEGTTAGLADDGSLLLLVGSQICRVGGGELEWL